MHKEQITDKEAICLIILFVLGSSLIIGIGGESKNDAWIAAIASALLFIPMLLLYSRLLMLFPGKDLYDILDIVLGKIFGKIIAVVYIWYGFHLGALVLRNFGEFINTVAMPETPMFVPMLCLGAVSMVGARLGVEVLGRTMAYFIPLVFFIPIVVMILGIPQLHINYLKPVLANVLSPVMRDSFSAFSFPFAETILFVGIFSSLKKKKSPLKVYLWGNLISAAFIITVTIRNIAMLGSMLGSFYFPTYEAVSRIRVGDYIERIEVSVAIVFILGAIVKSSICMTVACKGIAKLFNLKDYRSVVIQMGLLMAYFSYFIYDNIMVMKYWAFKVYPYYAFPMQVVIPIILWIFAELKAKKLKNEAIPPS
jgi:spore germination protein KB